MTVPTRFGQPILASPIQLEASDAAHLRSAIAWSATARGRGNRPFGSIVVAADGRVLAEAFCNSAETGDSTGHAETNAIRQLGAGQGREVLARSTLYASAEPCVMCAGAIAWSGIGRVVFGVDAQRLRALRGPRLDQRDTPLSCRDIFGDAEHPIECIGPALIDEACAPHTGYWKS